MTASPVAESETARAAAEAASRILLSAWRKPQEVRQKSPHDAQGGSNPVTDADEAADRAIREAISARFPDDGWLSEETKDEPSRLAKSRVWVVDPMDGTKDFLEGRPEFAVSIALVENGRPIFARIDVPAVGEAYVATRGGGAWKETSPGAAPVRIRAVSTLRDRARLTVSRTESKRGLFDGWNETFDLDPGGSIARKLCLVAEGAADGVVTLQPRSEWDVAAGVLIAEEAGCRVSLHDDTPIPFNRPHPVLATGLVAAPPWCHVRILERLRA